MLSIPQEWTISIHAPRAGGDYTAVVALEVLFISIHAPRAGGDNFVPTDRRYVFVFQSTPPVRGATEG